MIVHSASSAMNLQATMALPVVCHGERTGSANALVLTSSPTISTSGNCPQHETTRSLCIPAKEPSVGTSQHRDQPKKSGQKSKHGQTERYICTYENCNRSKPGSGFNRKDHLDQHIRGVHKQILMPRLRGASAGTVNSALQESTSTAEDAEQPKKRKRDSEDELGNDDTEHLSNELARERRLRQQTEKENQQLRRKIENYEERMQKYEDRLDRLMALLE